MKITPHVGGVSVNPNEGQSASPDRLARAKAVMQGQEPPAPATDTPVERTESRIKRLRMRTQMSPDRHKRPEEVETTATDPQSAAAAPVAQTTQPQPEQPVTAGAAPESTTPSDSVATTEQTQAQGASEETKPLSPQFAALARQKRALQVKEQQLAEREKALESNGANPKALEDYRARIKENALKVLLEEGVTYDQLTEQILAMNQSGVNVDALRAELKAEIKSEFETQQKTQAEREAETEKRVLTQIRREADQLIAQGDDYEMIREAGYAPKVVEFIHRTYKETGELLDTAEAAGLIETELLEEFLKFARLKKVQSKLGTAQEPKPAPTVQQDRPGTKTMRTLTNRDGASSLSMSKRERAIAAMEGRLTK